MNRKLISGLLVLFILPTTPMVLASHIFEDNTAFAQYLDIAELGAEKYPLIIDEKEFTIFYGWGGSLEIDIEELKDLDYPTVS